jgi:hypothetical protein
LSELHSDWSWLVGDEVLEGTSSDVVVKENAEVIRVLSYRFFIELKKLGGKWTRSVLNQVNKSLGSDVFSVKDTDFHVSLGKLLLSEAWSDLVKRKIAIIIWETLIKSLSEALVSIIWILSWSSNNLPKLT